ncbi:hypothetical protein MBLNU230_g5407t1 [Neophaeotheca triangularis]
MYAKCFTLASFAASALAARPFVNEPDTGYYGYFNDSIAPGQLPQLEDMRSLNDFDAAARNYLTDYDYTYYRAGAGGEWSYRNNLEAYPRITLRPRMMRDISNVESTFPTTAYGYNFSAPFFFSPVARGGYLHPEGENNIVQACAERNVLMVASNYASKTQDELYQARIQAWNPTDAPAYGNVTYSNATDPAFGGVEPEVQPFFQQMYLTGSNFTADIEAMRSYARQGAKAFVITIDAPASSNRIRAARYGAGSANTDVNPITWEYMDRLREEMQMPLIPKGILTIEDVYIAMEKGYETVYLSNHGGRQVDGTASPFEVAQEIHNQDPSVYDKIDVWVDGGVRYGTDILKLLALGVKMVGVGRGLYYPIIYGAEGVTFAIDMLYLELFQAAAASGVTDLKKISADLLQLHPSVPRYAGLA